MENFQFRENGQKRQSRTIQQILILIEIEIEVEEFRKPQEARTRKVEVNWERMNRKGTKRSNSRKYEIRSDHLRE